MEATDTAAAASAVGAGVRDIRGLIRLKRFAEAAALADTAVAAAPDDRDLLLASAMALRFAGRIDDALPLLERLQRLHPEFSRTFEEIGHCHAFRRQAPQAIEAFLQAVHRNHALPLSWSMLEGLYRITGQTADAATAASQVATLRKLPAEVVTATGYFMDGDLDRAETIIRRFLLEHGDQVEAMRLLARIGMARKVFDDAELLLSAVLERAPEYHAARAEYAEALIELHKYPQAHRELDRLIAKHPEGRMYYQGLYATACVGLGEHERAIGLYRQVLQGGEQDADTHLSIAHALKTLGQRESAITAYRQAAAYRPAFGDAYWSLANLKTYRFTAEEMTRMRAAEADSATSRVDRYHLCFALGKALEDQGEYAEAFRFYLEGNALKRAESRYRPEIIETNTRQQREVCTGDFFKARAGCGVSDADPIFIVGLPRSGSTLLEQILASHSLVEGTQELANVQQIVARLRGRQPDLNNPRYPRILAELDPAEFAKLGAQYLDTTRIYRRAGTPYFIDKMPNNFRHLGLIHLMLPNAKVIDARREPLACCFSNFKQLFAKGQEFTYGLDDIARYYRTYLELMGHWDAVLPGRVLRICHEDVVENLEYNVRRILDFCGLEFEPRCLEFHKTVRSVRTASSEQVRRPIYREGVEQWKHFEPWLTPLKEALGDAICAPHD